MVQLNDWPQQAFFFLTSPVLPNVLSASSHSPAKLQKKRKVEPPTWMLLTQTLNSFHLYQRFIEHSMYLFSFSIEFQSYRRRRHFLGNKIPASFVIGGCSTRKIFFRQKMKAVFVTGLFLPTVHSGAVAWLWPCDNPTFSGLPFCDTSLDYATRVADYVGRISLDDKLGRNQTNTPLSNTASPMASVGVGVYQWWSEALHGVASSPGVSFKVITSATSFPQVDFSTFCSMFTPF